MVEDWAKASNFNDYKPKKTLQDSMSYAVEQERLKQEEIKRTRKTFQTLHSLAESVTLLIFVCMTMEKKYLRSSK